MAITVYGLELSPTVRAVLLTAKALGITVNLKCVDIRKAEHLTPEFKKINPAHTIPVMDDDGYILWESRGITTYLVSRYGKDDRLYPKEVKARGKVDNMLYFDAATLCAALSAAYSHNWIPGKEEDPTAKPILEEKIAILDTILARQTFAAGSQFSLADISLLCSLTLPHASGFSFEKYPNILKWEERTKAEMPFYDQVTAEGLKQLAIFCSTKMEFLTK